MQRPELDALSLLAWPSTRTGSVEHSFLFCFFFRGTNTLPGYLAAPGVLLKSGASSEKAESVCLEHKIALDKLEYMFYNLYIENLFYIR